MPTPAPGSKNCIYRSDHVALQYNYIVWHVIKTLRAILHMELNFAEPFLEVQSIEVTGNTVQVTMRLPEADQIRVIL